MRIALGSDHAGLALKRAIVEHLGASAGDHTLDDRGTHDAHSVDYPDIAADLSRVVASGGADLGILVCGTGIGMSMAANRVPGVRAALCTHSYLARMTRAHNDANVLCLGERVVGLGVALDIVDAFITTPFEGGRHARRVEKINALDGAAHAVEPTPRS